MKELARVETDQLWRQHGHLLCDMDALDDRVAATSGLPGLPGADGEGAADEGEQHELGCSFTFYFIQDSEDEEGLTTGKVRTAPRAAPAFACLCLKRWNSRDL